MLLKVVFLLAFLLLFQSLEAKKKKQQSGISAEITSYMQSIGDLFQDAWDGFLDMLPSTTKKKPSKTKFPNRRKRIKRRKGEKTGWGLGTIVDTAKEKFQTAYDGIKESMGVFQRRYKRELEGGEGEEQSLEKILDDVVGVVWKKLIEDEVTSVDS